MSHYVPEGLPPVNSTEVRSFELPVIELNTNEKIIDSVAMYDSYVKSAVIRNLSGENMYYRTAPKTSYVPIPPLGEARVKGWFAFLDIRTNGDNLDGQLSLELTHRRDVIQ